jgi:hypothetical protein
MNTRSGIVYFYRYHDMSISIVPTHQQNHCKSYQHHNAYKSTSAINWYYNSYGFSSSHQGNQTNKDAHASIEAYLHLLQHAIQSLIFIDVVITLPIIVLTVFIWLFVYCSSNVVFLILCLASNDSLRQL